MAILANPRHEAFAKACAQGARICAAYEDAGYAPDRGHASRLAANPEVAHRIAELRTQSEDLTAASPTAIIAALLKAAKAVDIAAHPGALKEVRATLLEVQRLKETLASQRDADRGIMRHEEQEAERRSRKS